MTTFGDWPFLERLTNNEFLKLLPHLNLEQILLTEVFIPKKKWVNLLDANLETLQVKCGLCNRYVRFEDIKNHLIQNDHISLQSNVKQFYHPFYTYGKVNMKLARGENATQQMRENALREVNMQMKCFKKECIFAKQFAKSYQRKLKQLKEEEQIEASLHKRIENPDDMILMVSLPFEDISKLRFCVVRNEWRPVFGYKKLTKKTTVLCHICSVYCCGIESLNSHLIGFTHRSKQLEVLAFCYEDSSRVNKNCCIHFGNLFSFSIKEDIKNFQKNQVGNDMESWVTKLPNDIAEKVKKLNECVPKMLSSLENRLDPGDFKKVFERSNISEAFGKLGHLGVEYVLKIIKNEGDIDPRFECGLCEFVGDSEKMQRHLLLYEHKKKYLDLHYSDTIKKYESSIGNMCYKEFRTVMEQIVFILAAEIEKYHSRSLPYMVSSSNYKNRRPDLIAEAYSLLHASQNRGPSFSNVLSKIDIEILKNSVKQIAEHETYENNDNIIFTTPPKGKIYLNQMSHDPVVRLREYNAKLKKNLASRTNRSISAIQSQYYDSMKREDQRTGCSHAWIHDQRKHSRLPTHEKIKTPIDTHLGVRQESNVLNQNIWDVYRREISYAANEIEVSYENYRKNPESHPLYEEEWNTFWQHRKTELEREGYNYRSYNFQPEWVHYFKQRIEDLFGDALHTSKINIRNGLGIPLHAEEDYQRSKESVSQFVDRRAKDDAIVEKIDVHKRKISSDFTPQNKKLLPDQIQQRKDFNEINSELKIPKINDNHSNVVHVLRLITALEEHLGSLGVKVMDLLSNALQLEKIYSGKNIEFEAKVLTAGNCNLLETAMEKLKGILFAGLLDEKKISGFNRVIQHTANLLKYAEKMGWREEHNIIERKTFHNRDMQGNMYMTQNRNAKVISQVRTETPLSDTLIDFLNKPHTAKKQIEFSKKQYRTHTKEHPNISDCPPPPNIKENSINTNMFAVFNSQQLNSGLASFDTKLSLDQSYQTQDLQRELYKNKISGGSNLYNNSFKINNDTRTNNNGFTMGGDMNNSSGTPQFRNSQIIPNVGQNNSMTQGGGWR